ncbi:MAG: glutamate--cysteine ligase [Candidatus Dasytiphilus stammeri]
MIPDVSLILPWLRKHSHIFQNISRGIERETLRVQINGNIVHTSHPSSLGRSLTHKWVTTDFAEAQLEFISPIYKDINQLITFLYEIHHHVANVIGSKQERMWPLSMPGFISTEDNIILAQYGNSNIGKMKTLYRQGLKHRYGTMKQIITGVHYNFSLPLSFWQAWAGIDNMKSGKEIISANYMGLIRNYYRFGWIIPYLFGASPAICTSFLQGKKSSIHLKYHQKGNMLYLPFATSLRLSKIGYNSNQQDNLNINLNHLKNYVFSIKNALKTPCREYTHIGLRNNDNYHQLNNNILQIENEFYAPIRPKRLTYKGKSILDALLDEGIEYIEIRSLDINPFSPIGINLEQIMFLDLFLLWCLLTNSIEMNRNELIFTQKNWNEVVLYGRKPGLNINLNVGSHNMTTPISIIGKYIMQNLKTIASILDTNNNCNKYQKTCNNLAKFFDNPDLTYSSRILKIMMNQGIIKTGTILAEKYHNVLIKQSCNIITKELFSKENIDSCHRQITIESTDTMDFDSYLLSKKNK